MNENSASNELYKVAQAQGGFFTARQAALAGTHPSNHPYHTRVGNWVREWRSVYRLARFPLAEDWQYSLWGVWSLNRKGELLGTFSHETALTLHGATDVQPEKLHMIVPPSFRRHSTIPPVLCLHYSTVSEDECERRAGYQVTRPARTIADLVRAARISPEFVRQAVEQMLLSGQLTQQQYTLLTSTPRVGKPLLRIMGEASG